MCDAGAMTRLELSSLSSEHYPKRCRDGCQVRVSSEWCMKSINHGDQLSFVVIRFLIIACGSHLSSSNACRGGCEGRVSSEWCMKSINHEDQLSFVVISFPHHRDVLALHPEMLMQACRGAGSRGIAGPNMCTE